MPIIARRDQPARVQPIAAACVICDWSQNHGSLRRAARDHIEATSHTVTVTNQRIETWTAVWS